MINIINELRSSKYIIIIRLRATKAEDNHNEFV